MIFKSAPTISAKSILFINNKSDLVIPGPPFLGILSPADTSITYIDKSTSSGLKLDAKSVSYTHLPLPTNREV